MKKAKCAGNTTATAPVVVTVDTNYSGAAVAKMAKEGVGVRGSLTGIDLDCCLGTSVRGVKVRVYALVPSNHRAPLITKQFRPV